MKTISILVLFALTASSFAETKPEPNPEIAKIDARLAVLQGFYNEENGIINRLTNFKRNPIRVGTPAYNEFLVADKRMKQIAVEAKALKEKRTAILEQKNPDSSDPTASGGRSNGSSGNAAQVESEALTTITNPEEYEKFASVMKEHWDSSLLEEKARNADENNEDHLVTQEQRAAYAALELSKLNPGGYLHPLERLSPTLDFLKAEISLQGKNLREIEAFYSKEDFLGLLGFLQGTNFVEYPDAEKIDLLCEKLSEMDFFIKLKPTVETTYSYMTENGKADMAKEEIEVDLLPSVITVEAHKTWYASVFLGEPENFEAHPDGKQAGYLMKWNPSSGPVVLKLPFRPHAFTRLMALEKSLRASVARVDSFGDSEEYSAIFQERQKLRLSEMGLLKNRISETNTKLLQLNTSLEKKVEIGEITKEESEQNFIKYKSEEYQNMLQFLSEW